MTGSGLAIVGSAIAINLVLALIKISVGVIGNSYALIADGIESTADIFSSLIVWSSLQVSSKPADKNHPYGHGKAESMAGLLVALFLMGSGLFITVQAIHEIVTPQLPPAWYTLPVLGLIILIKENLYRRMHRVGTQLHSSSLRSDAWHHRTDAITSLSAFVGISIALVAGEGYESADDWAALLACVIIFINGIRLLKPALDEMMDASASGEIKEKVIQIASSVKGVEAIEKCRIRKSGLGYLMDIHVEVGSEISVQKGHSIGHIVKDRLMNSSLPITDVVIHIEPANRKLLNDQKS
jgi:cation diffusion facilitator family transporter